MQIYTMGEGRQEEVDTSQSIQLCLIVGGNFRHYLTMYRTVKLYSLYADVIRDHYNEVLCRTV